GAAGVKTGRRPPRRGVVLTLAAAGAHWAIGTGGGAGSGHGFLRKKLRGRRVRVARAPGLTSVRGTALAGSGDMMIDGVVPLGVWPRRSFEAVRVPGGSGQGRRAGAMRGVGQRGDGHGASVA